MSSLEKNTKNPKKYRALLETEIALAREVFEDTLPYERIFIAKLKTHTQGITLATRRKKEKANYILLWSNAFARDITTDEKLKNTLIHELVHVWQSQYGKTAISYMRKSAWAQFHFGVKDIFRDGFGKGTKNVFRLFGKNFGKKWGRHRNTAYCFDCEKIGEDFKNFNVEQQALIIESWFSKEIIKVNKFEYPPGFASEEDFRFPYVRDCIRKGSPNAPYISSDQYSER